MNKKIIIHFYLIGLFFLIVSCSSQNDLLNQDYVIKGETLYINNCINCHGVNLQGQKGWENELDSDGHRLSPPLNGTGHTWHHSDELLHRMIKYGFAKLIKNYEGKMMGFGDKISDEGIDNILSYIKSYWKDDIYEYHLEMSKK